MRTARSSLVALSALLGSSAAFQIVTHKVIDGWPWVFPFTAEGGPPPGFLAPCSAQKTFHAREHKLSDLAVPDSEGGLANYADGIKYFFGGRPFPGGWDGLDWEDVLREMLVMEWSDVPNAVREWIAWNQEPEQKGLSGRWLFGVFRKSREEGEKIVTTARAKETPVPGKEDEVLADEDKLLFFPPGSLYETLPLWVGVEAEDYRCKEQLLDLRKYSETPTDGGVVAWPINHSAPDLQKGSRDITFTILAQSLVEDPEYEPPAETKISVPVRIADGAGAEEVEDTDFQLHDAVAHDAVMQSAVLVDEPGGGEEGTATMDAHPVAASTSPTVLDTEDGEEKAAHDEL